MTRLDEFVADYTADATEPANNSASMRPLSDLRGRDVACPVCGYNLRDLTRPVCPEYGEVQALTVAAR